MRILVSITLLLCFSSVVAQTDSVLIVHYHKLTPKYEIYIDEIDNLKKEEYTYFKGRYWHDKTEEVHKDDFVKMLLKLELNKKIRLTKNSICDSLVNHIRNSSYYWETRSDINIIARQEIGFRNEEFNNLKNSQNNRIKNFSEKCQDEFNIELSELKDQLLKEVQQIKKGKTNRLSQLRMDPESINSIVINSFLETFDLCETDLKTLELIILQNPTVFLSSIDKLSDSDFFTFTLYLDDFPEGSNISKMKETLKESEQRSRRKKKVIRKIKKRKANKC